MAGRYLLLEFKSEEEYREWVLEKGEGNTVKGVYYKPTFFCTCSDKTKQTAGNWVRGRKFGIFICRQCRRPSIFHQRGVEERLKWALGKNLIGGSK